MTHFSEHEWQRLRAGFEARASQYHNFKLSIHYVVQEQLQPEVQFAQPNHAISLWQYFGHMTRDESIASLEPLEPTQFGMSGAAVGAFAVIAGHETDLFRRMAERAGSLIPGGVGQRITLELARFFDAYIPGKPLYVCNPNPLAKWLNLVLVTITTHQPHRFQTETLAVDPFAASLVALDFLRHKLPALQPVAGRGLIPVAIQQIAGEIRSLAMNLHCCYQDLKAEQSAFLMQRVNEQLVRIEALLPQAPAPAAATSWHVALRNSSPNGLKQGSRSFATLSLHFVSRILGYSTRRLRSCIRMRTRRPKETLLLRHSPSISGNSCKRSTAPPSICVAGGQTNPIMPSSGSMPACRHAGACWNPET